MKKTKQSLIRSPFWKNIPVEGKFGQGKRGYDLGYIKTKRADTSEAYINSIFLVMNLLVLLKIFFAQHKVLLRVLIKKIDQHLPLLHLKSKAARPSGSLFETMGSKSMLSF